MSNELTLLANSIATTLCDYEKVNNMNADHVMKWVDKFNTHDPIRLLRNTDSLLSKTYISKKDYLSYLQSVAHKHASATFLNIQIRGSSQNKMLTLLSTLYKETHNQALMSVYTDTTLYNPKPIVNTSGVSSHDKNYQHFVYLDDVSFTGNRIMDDLTYWISNNAPRYCTLHIKVIAAHTQGVDDIRNKVARISDTYRKNIDTIVEYYDIYENRQEYLNGSDVFCPKNGTILIPQDIVDGNIYRLRESTYIEQYAPAYRRDGFSDDGGIFSNETERDWYEKIICEKGLELINMGVTEKSWLKPLGFKKEDGLGFGGTVFTYLNCPNNTPLAFWWGTTDAFYPLMPRTPS